MASTGERVDPKTIQEELQQLKTAVREGAAAAEDRFQAAGQSFDEKRKEEIAQLKETIGKANGKADDIVKKYRDELTDHKQAVEASVRLQELEGQGDDPTDNSDLTVYDRIDAYVSYYEAYLTAQATCWSRWRILGTDAGDKAELRTMYADTQEYELQARRALQVLGAEARDILERVKSDSFSAVTQNIYINKTQEDLDLPRTKYDLDYIVRARLVCRHKNYRPFIIQQLVALMGR
jgi:hypothetical protein